MLHLFPDRLAALADDEPTALEAQHLAACARCASERSAQRTLLALARREGPRPAERLTEWSTLSEQLRAEGLLARDAAPAVSPRPTAGRRGWMRAAAAVLLAVGGAAAGRLSAGAPVLAFGTADSRASETLPNNDPGGGARLVADDGRTYASTTEAVAAFLSAQREMNHAAAFLAEREQDAVPEGGSRAYRARLAATEGMVAVSRAALYEAPADPYINQYYLASLGAREAAIRQIGRAVPQGAQLVPY